MKAIFRDHPKIFRNIQTTLKNVITYFYRVVVLKTAKKQMITKILSQMSQEINYRSFLVDH